MDKKKLKRKDSFFGLHFDFHANEESVVGERVTPEIFERYITEVQPDYIQVDSKGHGGWASYPSKLGNHPKIKQDILRMYRDITAKHNVALYVHYSGVWDVRYVKEHPQYAVVDENGNTSANMTSSFGPYMDELMIPQLIELSDDYGIDGVWVDGDCWAVEHDYSVLAKPYLPRNLTLYQHGEIMREAFKRNLKKYVDALHEHNPDFQVASNWAYTSYMPEKVDVDVDFLSGDYPYNNSIRVARYEGRCISAKGKPWDLMDWGFDIISNCNYYKTAVQLKQEAAVVISLGGGFQIYNNQNPDGSVNAYPIAQAKETAEFCRKRQVYNHKKIPIGQVGVYYSEKARYKNSNMFNAAGSTNAMIGVLGCILDAQHTAEIFYEYQMHTMERFDAVVFPEWDRITAEEKQNLLGYAENGGNLIVIGAKASKLFEDVLPVEWIEYHEKQRIYLMQDGILGGFETNFYEADGVGVKCYRWLDETSVYCTSIVKVSYGKGTVTAMLFDLGSSYFDLRSFALRNLMDDTLCSLYQPMVRLNQKNIDITIQKDGEKRIINLININGEHADDQVSVYDFVPPVYHLMVKIDMQNQYKKITMPLHGEHEVQFRMNGDYAEFEIDITDLHEILVLE